MLAGSFLRYSGGNIEAIIRSRRRRYALSPLAEVAELPGSPPSDVNGTPVRLTGRRQHRSLAYGDRSASFSALTMLVCRSGRGADADRPD